MKVYCYNFGDLLTNTYLCVGDGGECVVVDPGLDGRSVANKLKEKGLTPSHILLTHGHFDHVFGVRDLVRETGAKVVIHTADAEMLADPYKNAAAHYFGARLEEYPSAKADLLVNDGDVVSVGSLDFSVVHTPGHTKGSVLYLCKDLMFSGDTLFSYGFGRTDLYGGSTEEMMRSLGKILALPGNPKLLPGHGNSSHLDRERDNIRAYLYEWNG